MDILVTKNNVQIDTREIVHEGEYNVNTLFFTFTQDYDGLSKMAVFSNLTNSYELAITNNMCLIPAEIVADRGCFTLGVYAYTMVDDEIVKRYSPAPIELKIDDGSYVRALNPQGTEPTLFQTFAQQVEGQFDEMSGAIGDNTEEINDLKDRATALENGKQDNLTAGSHITINNNVISSDGEPNVITKIQKNGSDLPINNKTVNVEVPTSTNELINNSGYITKEVNDLTNYLLKVNTGATLEATINNTTYVMTLKLKNSSGTALSTQTIDLPLETMVINASYDSATKEIVLYLKNGNTVRFSVADLIDGLQKEITPTNKLSSDLVDDTNKTHKFVTQAEKAKLAGIEAGAEVNVIEKVKVNDEELPTENKSVNIDLTPLEAEITALKQENTELLAQIPTATAEGEVINIQDSSNLPIKDFSMSGNTTQDTNILTYKCDGTETGDYYFVYDNTNYQFTMPTITQGELLTFNTTTLKLYQGTTQITTTTASTGTLITLNATPNPDYPQDIKVVTGDVEVDVIGKNWLPNFKNETKNHVTFTSNSPAITINGTNTGSVNTTATRITLPAGTYTLSARYVSGSITGTIQLIGKKVGELTDFINVNYGTDSYTKDVYRIRTLTTTTTLVFYFYFSNIEKTFDNFTLNIQLTKTNGADYDFAPYTNPKPTLHLGSIELAKIGKYQDRIYKQDGKWWLKKNIGKITMNGSELWGISTAWDEHSFFISNSRIYGNALPVAWSPSFSEYFKSSNATSVTTLNNEIVVGGSNLIVNNTKCDTYEEFKTWLTTHNTNMYYILVTPITTEITDTTLVAQLENVLKMQTYKNISNIFTVTDNAIPTLEIEYRQDLETMFDNLTNAVVSLGNNT